MISLLLRGEYMYSEDLKMCVEKVTFQDLQITDSIKESVLSSAILMDPYRGCNTSLISMEDLVFSTKELVIYKWNRISPIEKITFLKVIASNYFAKLSSLVKEKAVDLNNFYINLFETVFDATEGFDKDCQIQELRANICKVIPTRRLDFRDKFLQYKMDPVISKCWYELGIRYSTDLAFFRTIWNSLEYKKGYVDERAKIIGSCFNNCGDFPEVMIKDLSEKGHCSNKFYIVKIITDIIVRLRCKSSRSGDEEFKIDYFRELCGRFIQGADSKTIRYMIPVLNENQLLFAAPAAIEVGLSSDIEKALNRLRGVSRT